MKSKLNIKYYLRKKSKGKSVYSIINFICVLSSIPFLCYLTSIFFSKSVEKRMQIYYLSEFYLPSFSICTEFKNLIDYNLVIENKTFIKSLKSFFNLKKFNFQIWKKLDNEKVVNFFGTMIELKELLYYTKDLEDIIKSISIYGVDNLPKEDMNLNNEEIGEKYCEKSLFLKENYLCILIKCNLKDDKIKISIKKTSNSHINKNVILEFKFHFKAIKYFDFFNFAAHYESFLDGQNNEGTYINLIQKPQLYSFEMVFITSTLKPSPNNVICLNYTRKDNTRALQQDLRSSCFFRKIRQKNMVFFSNSVNLTFVTDYFNDTLSLLDRPRYNGLLNNFLDNSNITNITEAYEIYNYCNIKYIKPDCLSIFFIVLFRSPVDINSFFDNSQDLIYYNDEFLNLVHTDSLKDNFTTQEIIPFDDEPYSNFQMVNPSHPLIINYYFDTLELKDYIFLMASIYGTFTTFRVSLCIKRLFLWGYSAFHM